MDTPFDWLVSENFDDLDAETQEDIEVRLYGMIHHATNDELYSEKNNVISTVPTSDKTGSSETSSKQNCNEPETSTPLMKSHYNECFNNNQENSMKFIDQQSNSKEKMKASNQSPFKTTSTIKKSKSPEQELSPSQLLTRNPFKEYLVVEESNKSRIDVKRKREIKDSDVITISDDEDSRYISINKLAKAKEDVERNTKVTPDTSESEEESETDDSIIFVDTKPEDSDTFSLTSSESSDSEIEIISNSRKFINTSSELKLNTSQTLMGSSIPTTIHAPEVEEWQRFCSKKWTPEMITYYSSAAAKVDLEAMMRSIPRNVNWHLDREDRFGPDLQRNRYFAKSDRGRCTNCKQCGHTAKACPDPRKVSCCILCGRTGHKMQACQKKICLTCGQPKKILIECCLECRKEKSAVCMICRQKHVTTRCPDLWRRFHMTTSALEDPTPSGTSLKPSRVLYCCNCAGRGHLPKDCRDVRWSKYPVIDPTVRSYENPRTFLESITQNGSSTVTRSDDGNAVWVVDNPSDYSANKRARHLKYYIPQENLSSEKQLQSAASSVMSEVKHVAITWRIQKKKRRIVVEFDGNGNTHEARTKFKKAFTFSKKSSKAYSDPKKSPSKAGERNHKGNGTAAASSSVNGKKFMKENGTESKNQSIKISRGNADYINELVINTLNSWGNASHRVLKVRLTQTDKRHLGQHLSKFEQKHHVTITSTVSGQKLEITIHSGPHGRLSAAVNAVIRCLDIMSKKSVNA